MSFYSIINVKELLDKKQKCLEEIIKINDEINNYENYLPKNIYKNICIYDDEKINILKCENRNKYAQELLVSQISIQKSLNSMCNHIYVEDYIDISPEKSQKIKYCCLCELP